MRHQAELPKVSIIIPCYDQANLLLRAVNSVLVEKSVPIEVIVIDDGSTHSAFHVLEKIEDQRLHFVRHEDNRGVAEARNTGLNLARGKWVRFLDADDYMMPSMLEGALKLDVNSDILYGDWLEIDNNKQKKLRPDFDPTGNVYEQLLTANVFPIHSVLVKREILMDINGFDGEVYHEDWDLWLRLSKVSKHGFHYVGDSGAVYCKSLGTRSYDAYQSARHELTYLLSLRDRKLPIKDDAFNRILRKKYYQLALLELVKENKKGVAGWLSHCEPLTLVQKVEIALAGSPVTRVFLGKFPGPRKLKRLIKNSWRGL